MIFDEDDRFELWRKVPIGLMRFNLSALAETHISHWRYAAGLCIVHSTRTALAHLIHSTRSL